MRSFSFHLLVSWKEIGKDVPDLREKYISGINVTI